MLIQQIFPSVIFFCAAAAYSAHGVLALTMATRQWRSSAPKTRVCRMLFELHTSILPTASLLYNEYVECSKNICLLLVFQYWLTQCDVTLHYVYAIVLWRQCAVVPAPLHLWAIPLDYMVPCFCTAMLAASLQSYI